VPTLRLLSYNVRSLRDDPLAVARVIRSADPHVVCIQEAPRFLRWRSKCAELARRSGLVVVTGGRSAAANLILSTLAVDVERRADVLFTRDPKLHQRGTAIAQMSLGGVRFAVAGTHLDLVEAPRRRHVAELDAAIAANVDDGIAAFVMGDFNDDPGSAVWSRLGEDRVDAWAVAGQGPGFTADLAPGSRDPRRRIDGVFTPPSVTVGSVTVLDQPDVLVASDHRPLLVEVHLVNSVGSYET
jgi:endonuclease/exonuclease/phosphatase family metal-dependent hydrolase